MEPLLVFIAKIRAWHVLLACAAALIFVIVSHLTDKGAVPRAVSLQQSLLAMIAIPVMIFTIAFLAFASMNDQFRAMALFPSVFLVVSAFIAVGIVSFKFEDPDAPILILAPMGLILSVLASGMVCVMIAIRQKVA